MVTDILNDNRDIIEISSVDGGSLWRVGFDGVTKIVAYEEHGWATWFAVYVGDDIQWRVPAYSMVVEYGTIPTPEEEDAKMEEFLHPRGWHNA